MGRPTDPEKKGFLPTLLRSNMRQTPRQILWDYGQITLGCLMMVIVPAGWPRASPGDC